MRRRKVVLSKKSLSVDAFEELRSIAFAAQKADKKADEKVKVKKPGAKS